MSAVGGLLVPLVTPFAHDGTVDLEALERLAHEVLDDGADGLVALATTAEASSLDERERAAVLAVCSVVVYNIPYRTGRGVGAEALLELAATDGVVGLKQAVGAVDADTLRLLAAAPPDFAVLCGDDAFILPLVLMGARGAIAASAHLCTDRFAALVAAADEGRLDDARRQAEALRARPRALRRAQPGGAQGDAPRRRPHGHARRADAAGARVAGRPRAR